MQKIKPSLNLYFISKVKSVYILNIHNLGETNSMWIRYSVLPFYILLMQIGTFADRLNKVLGLSPSKPFSLASSGVGQTCGLIFQRGC